MQHLVLNDYIYFKGGFSVEIRVELVTDTLVSTLQKLFAYKFVTQFIPAVVIWKVLIN